MGDKEKLQELKKERINLENESKLKNQIEKEEKKIEDLKPKNIFGKIIDEVKKYKIELK